MLEMSDMNCKKNLEQNHLHIIVVCTYAKRATYRLCKKKVYLALFEKKTRSPLEFTA